ncbi:MAG: hypothetical protein EOO65_02200 [Methanosarcinales archaeon]|nr:MAG: hypothetical protein EOO65_02200 [Methanosarcinales archaeon]
MLALCVMLPAVCDVVLCACAPITTKRSPRAPCPVAAPSALPPLPYAGYGMSSALVAAAQPSAEFVAGYGMAQPQAAPGFDAATGGTRMMPTYMNDFGNFPFLSNQRHLQMAGVDAHSATSAASGHSAYGMPSMYDSLIIPGLLPADAHLAGAPAGPRATTAPPLSAGASGNADETIATVAVAAPTATSASSASARQRKTKPRRSTTPTVSHSPSMHSYAPPTSSNMVLSGALMPPHAASMWAGMGMYGGAMLPISMQPPSRPAALTPAQVPPPPLLAVANTQSSNNVVIDAVAEFLIQDNSMSMLPDDELLPSVRGNSTTAGVSASKVGAAASTQADESVQPVPSQNRLHASAGAGGAGAGAAAGAGASSSMRKKSASAKTSLKHLGGKGALQWSEKEDALLREGVERFGSEDWLGVASCVPKRTAQQCMSRWIKALHNSEAKGPWTPEEEEVIRNAVRE